MARRSYGRSALRQRLRGARSAIARATARSSIVVLSLVVLTGLTLAGCSPRSYHSAPWHGGPKYGRIVLTEHYALHTTIDEPDFLAELAQTMESTHRLYAKLAPPASGPRRHDGYVYAYRDEWAEYTQTTAGPSAPVYLQIHRGGYAHEDVFATFFHGRPQTLAVCRHEGWHQYVADGFERRLPPFIEEGVATLFEAGFEGDNLAKPEANGARQLRLMEAVRQRRAWPLRTLLGMHAGDVIGKGASPIDTFYAQAWALARFLLESDRYHQGFRNLMAAYADGTAGSLTPVAALEHYLDAPFEQIEHDYQRYVRQLAGVGGDGNDQSPSAPMTKE